MLYGMQLILAIPIFAASIHLMMIRMKLLLITMIHCRRWILLLMETALIGISAPLVLEKGRRRRGLKHTGHGGLLDARVCVLFLVSGGCVNGG